jgi:hypothetical protein
MAGCRSLKKTQNMNKAGDPKPQTTYLKRVRGRLRKEEGKREKKKK